MSYANTKALGTALSQMESKEECCKCFELLPLEVKIKLVQSELDSAPQDAKKFVVHAASLIAAKQLQAEIHVDESAKFCNVLAAQGSEEHSDCSVQVIDLIGKTDSLPTDSKVMFVMALSPESIKANETAAVELMCKPEVRSEIWRNRSREAVAEKLSALSEDNIRQFCEGDAKSPDLDKKKAQCLITFDKGKKVLAGILL